MPGSSQGSQSFVLANLERAAVSGFPSFRQPRECLQVYSVDRVDPRKTIGPARSIDHVLILAEATGPGRYEVSIVGDSPRHLCFVTRHADGTFTIDPRKAGGLTAALHDTLTRA
jgi:hypothetical protein